MSCGAKTPEFGVLAEEGPEDEPVPLDAEYLWIVDPICGSLNCVQGNPVLCRLNCASRSWCDPRWRRI